jgi:hypothetical protein
LRNGYSHLPDPEAISLFSWPCLRRFIRYQKDEIIDNSGRRRKSNKNEEAPYQMPSIKYTRIEITSNAYRSLEAEAILQGKTLKKLASELILKGVSRKAIDFVKESPEQFILSEPDMKLDEKTAEIIEKIGAVGMHISDATLESVKDAILDDGYQGAMLYVAQNTASMERDELHRVLAIFRNNRLSIKIAAYLIENLNEIESGKWK